VIEYLGRMEEALEAIEPGVAIFEELGARWEFADALAERGILKRELGRLDEAEEDLGLAIRISEELGERQLAGWTWTALARVSERRGDEAEAKERFERAEEAKARRAR
jgi:tetratricopeptide (TPR) repeat protein